MERTRGNGALFDQFPLRILRFDPFKTPSNTVWASRCTYFVESDRGINPFSLVHESENPTGYNHKIGAFESESGIIMRKVGYTK